MTTRPASFDAWLHAALAHDVTEPEWYWADDFDERWEALQLTEETTVAYLTRLFVQPVHLEGYSLAQVAQGIWFLVGESSPTRASDCLLSVEVPLESRIACVRAMADFFELFVLPLAGGRAQDQSDPFHIACYMWWDILPLHLGDGEAELHQACLATMARIFDLPSELCQLSALHGLNHWSEHHGGQVTEIVDRFLRRGTDITARVWEYAAIARQGPAL